MIAALTEAFQIAQRALTLQGPEKAKTLGKEIAHSNVRVAALEGCSAGQVTIHIKR